MDDDRDLLPQKQHRPALLRRRIEIFFRQHLDDIDFVEMRENAHADFAPPSEAEPHDPHPPHPPPHPPPHDDPHDDPHEDPQELDHDDDFARGKRSRVHEKASPDNAATPNTPASSATSAVAPPGRTCAARSFSAEKRF